MIDGCCHPYIYHHPPTHLLGLEERKSMIKMYMDKYLRRKGEGEGGQSKQSLVEGVEDSELDLVAER